MKSIQGRIIQIAMLMVACNLLHAKEFCKQRDGSLDTTFGQNGKVITDVDSGDDTANAVVVLPCGRIVAAGTANGDFALVGYTPFGGLDTAFGDNGKVITDVATELNPSMDVVNLPSSDFLSAAVLQKDCNGCADLCPSACNLSCTHNCNIVVVGSSTALSTDPAVAVARYKCDGTLDTSFGLNNSGITVIPIGILSAASAVAIQEDNKIVVVGGVVLEPDDTAQFFVMRFNCDGTLDQTFGCDHSGIVIVSIREGFNDVATAVKIQQDGKIVVGGTSGIDDPTGDFALIRLTKRGRLDIHFGPHCDGKVLTPFSDDDTSRDSLRALVLVEDCVSCFDCAPGLRIVAVGTSTPEDAESRFALAGYTEDGCLECSFGVRGLVTTSFGAERNASANAAILQNDCTQKCKIIVGGTVAESGEDSVFALARYTLGGTLDTHFGIGGKAETMFTGLDASLNALARQENGDIIAGGAVRAALNDFALARYNVCTPCCAPVCAAGCGSDCARVC